MRLRRLVLPALPVLALGSFVLPAHAQGGACRGPGASVPPAGGWPGGAGGSVAGQPVLPAPTGTSPGAGTPDLTRWGLWWSMNQARYLELKTAVRSVGPSSGTEGWFLGDGQREQAISLGPTEDQIRRSVVPALLAVLERESDDDLVTGAIVALAKIGDGADAGEGARIERALAAFLTAPSQEVRETAAIALGILASPRSVPVLAHLLWDTSEGREAVRASEVNYRTRAFAAYGLGLTGARSASETDRQMVVAMLRRALERDDTRSRDLEVACLNAIGMVPLATIETAGAVGTEELPPERGRLAQIEYLLAVLGDERREPLARAQCPVALARLLVGLAEPQRSAQRERIAADLLRRIERDQDKRVVLESCVLALGQIGTNDDSPLDATIRRALTSLPTRMSDPVIRSFALLAAAEAGGRFTPGRAAPGVGETRATLVEQLAWGKNALETWSALACGVLARRLSEGDPRNPALDTLRKALRRSLDEEGSPERLGAHALGAGLAGSSESAPRLMKLLEKELDDEARGQVAIALALLGHLEAVEPLRGIVARSRYRPELLSQAAIALALLGDKDVPTQLAGLLAEAHSLAAQAAITTALGFIGDRRSVDPLLALLGDRLATAKARAFAAVALGNVADKELRPWNSKIGFGLNYLAAPATLFDPLGGKGILDIR